MAGEEAYYNPIIRSMVETAQLQQHAQQLQQQKEFQTAEIRNRQRLADLHEKQIEQQHQQYLNTLKNVHIPQVQAALEAHKIANIEEVRRSIAAGVSPTAYQQPATQGILPGAGSFTVPGTPEGMLNVPGVGLRPMSAFPTAAEEATRAAQRAGGIVSAQFGAKEPFEIREHERTLTGKKELQDFENQFKERLTDKEIASHEKMNKLNNDTQML